MNDGDVCFAKITHIHFFLLFYFSIKWFFHTDLSFNLLLHVFRLLITTRDDKGTGLDD